MENVAAENGKIFDIEPCEEIRSLEYSNNDSLRKFYDTCKGFII